jgi:hypothetical protein
VRFTIAELLVATAAVGAACVWPVLWVPFITLGLSLYVAAKSRPVGTALAVVATCLYAPFAWLLVIDYGWGEYRLFWLNLWPIMPGFLVGMYLFHPHDVAEFTTMGATTVVLLLGLTWLGSGSRWRLLAAATIALAVSVPQAFMAHAVFRA